MTAINKPSVNDTTINYNLNVGSVKAGPTPIKRGEHVSNLSVADQIWQGTKSGLKMSAWTGSANFAGLFTAPDCTKYGEAAVVNIVIGLAPIAIGAVSGTVSAILGKDDKVGKAMNKMAGGELTPLNVGFKVGLVANGLMMPNLAADALRACKSGVARVATATTVGLITVAGTAGAAYLGGRLAKGSASAGGAVFAGIGGGAVVGGAGALIMEVGRHALCGTLKSEGNIKGALIVGAVYGAAAGIAGALVQYNTRK